MWYVIQVRALHEFEVAKQCKRDVLIDGEDIFVFQTEHFVRKGKLWEIKRTPTFQKYLFVETDDVDDFRLRLRAVKQMTKFLGTGDEITPIYPEEEKWLMRLGGPDHIITVSEASYEGKDIVVNSGALEGLEGDIRWIDKRQKAVGVGVSILGHDRVINVGMEFIDPPKITETGS